MNFLADTHVLIWALNSPTKLSPAITERLTDSSSPCFYSPISIWEIAIKYSLGKLDLRSHTPEEFLAELEASFFTCLPLANQIIATSHQLPRLHGDPFDRMLIWQAISTDFTLLSADAATEKYAQLGLSVIH
jgi:PIN domain nuclease of toxin-antitoxin system